MIIYGGTTAVGEVNTGYAYNMKKGKWRALTSSGSPSKRAAHSALWTGSNLWVLVVLTMGFQCQKLRD